MSSAAPIAPKRILHIVGRMDRAGAETMLMNYYRSIAVNAISSIFWSIRDMRLRHGDRILGGRS